MRYADDLAAAGKVDILRDKLGVTGPIGSKLTGAQRIQAGRKIVERTQFKVDPQDLPGWADHPAGKIVAQFRTFSYNQSKFFSNEILKPAAKGNIAPLTRFMAAFPIGYGLMEARQLLDNRPEGQDKTGMEQFRDYLEAFGKTGGAGLALDIPRGLIPLTGKYTPPERIVSMATGTLGGPSVGMASEAIGSVANAIQGKTDQLQRFGMRQVPVIGNRIQNTLKPYIKKEDKSGGTLDTDKKDIYKAGFNTPEGIKFMEMTADEKKQSPLYDRYKAMQKAFSAPLQLPNDMSKDSSDVLQRYNRMTTDAKEDEMYAKPDAEYKLRLAEYERDKLDGKISKAEEIKKQGELLKMKVGSTFNKEVREFYGLNKTQLYSYLTNDPNGQALADQIVALDDALVANGALAKNKFRDKYGNIDFDPSSSGGGSGKGGKGKAFNSLTVKSPETPQLSSIQVGKPSGQLAKKPGVTKIAKRKTVRIGGAKIKGAIG